MEVEGEYGLGGGPLAGSDGNRRVTQTCFDEVALVPAARSQDPATMRILPPRRGRSLSRDADPHRLVSGGISLRSGHDRNVLDRAGGPSPCATGQNDGPLAPYRSSQEYRCLALIVGRAITSEDCDDWR